MGNRNVLKAFKSSLVLIGNENMLSQHLDFAFQEQKFWDNVNRHGMGKSCPRGRTNSTGFGARQIKSCLFLTGGGTSGEAPSLLETQFPHLGNGNNSASWIVQLFSMCDPRTAVSASLENLLEMQNLRFPPGLTASEILGVAQHTFHKPSRWFKFEDLQPVD